MSAHFFINRFLESGGARREGAALNGLRSGS